MVKEYRDIQIAGIQCARVSARSKKDCSDLVVAAVKKLLERLETEPEEIGTMIYITQSPRFMTPSTSFYIHKELGMGIDCFQYDVNQGASGFLTGIQLVSSLMSGFEEKRTGLVLFGDNNLLKEGKKENQAAALLLRKNKDDRIYVKNYSEGAAYKGYFQKHQQEKSDVMADFLETGKEILQNEMEQLQQFAEREQIKIDDRYRFHSLFDSAVQIPVHLSETGIAGTVMLGAMGAGRSIAVSICRLNSDIYDTVIID